MAARPSRTLAAVVLAAGEGKRLRSAVPKVLHPVCGKPALWHVLRQASAARPDRIIVVVGHGADDVRAAVRSWAVSPAPVFVEQTRQLGTGHAVLVAKRAVGRVDDVLILTGDFDPVRPEDVRALVAKHRRSKAAATVASTILSDPGGYGRVVRARGKLVEVVEDVDASPEVRAIDEVSLISMAVRRADLFRALPRLDRKNRQREYYLNRILPLLIADGEVVRVVPCDTGGAMGLNSRAGLAAVEDVIRRRIAATHMAAGVTLVDPGATYIDVEVTIGHDTVIHPDTYLYGDVHVGVGAVIGPATKLVDAEIGDRATVEFSVVERSRVLAGAHVGPYARVRGGALIGDDAEVGNFVEVKGSRLGRGAKAKHLAYLGDADIGTGANIGAGTVTVNYDGASKHRTVIGDGASIGSDTMLVAPVEIGEGAVTGAGSVITKDVPAGALAIERSEQRIVPGYATRKKAERRAKGRGR